MSDQPITHEIDLIEGYRDKQGAIHKHVVFGKRISAKALIALDTDPQGRIPTQYRDLVLSKSIIEFGALPMPVSLLTLLELDTVDRDDLREASNVFGALSLGDREIDIAADGSRVKLAWGFKIGDVRYDVVEFGNRLSGRDEVDADNKSLKQGISRACFLAGRAIKRISSSDGTAAIDGPVELVHFNSEDFDADDLYAVVSASELWRQSFRFRGRNVSKVGDGANGSAAGDEAGGRPGPVAGKAAGAD
jgi:hypothetical protein